MLKKMLKYSVLEFLKAVKEEKKCIVVKIFGNLGLMREVFICLSVFVCMQHFGMPQGDRDVGPMSAFDLDLEINSKFIHYCL